MELLYLILLFPLVWPWIAKRLWGTEITKQEMFLNIVIIIAACITTWEFGRYSKMSDTEIWNGQVIQKEQVRVSCEHSYSCNCRTDSKGTPSCDICYEHMYDWDWVVRSSAGEFNIDRVDRRGSDEPPRWTAVRPGQPVALAKSYDNYIKAAPFSLFNEHREVEKSFASKIPGYPQQVYDYHYVDRVITIGVPLPDLKQWNTELALLLRSLGPEKQVNVILVFVDTKDPTYANALSRAWLGGKKNDVVVIIGSTSFPKIDWVRVLSWTDEKLFVVQLRDELLEQKSVDKNKVLSIVSKHIQSTFKRKNMKDFEYLKDEIQPDDWVIILVGLLAVFGSLGLTALFYFYEVDLTDPRNIIRKKYRHINRRY